MGLTLSLAGGSSTAQNLDLQLPDFGDSSAQYLSQRDERRLGADVLKRLRERRAVIDDVQLDEYLNSIGQRLAANAQGGHPYTFFWVDDSDINAFALPGSYIGVNTGLLLATRSEDELAGVVAHEVAHVAQRHIAQAYADAKRRQLPMAAALLASAALTAANSEAGQAALASTLAASMQRQINFTRSNEQEADRIGYQLLDRSGFDPDGMSRFFAYLMRSPNEAASAIPDFLRTHPRPASRVADTQGRLGTADGRSHDHASSLDFYLAQARAQVLTTPNTTTLINHYQDILQKGTYRNALAERYGLALALRRAGRYREAAVQLDRLLAADPDRLAFRIEQAELALASGDTGRAWRLFEQTLRLYPDDYRLAMHYGQALAKQGDPRRAQQLLEPFLKRRQRDLGLYELYAQAAQRAGNGLATHAAMAEYYYLSGDLEQAVEQAELGLRRGDASTYERARLQARLRELKEAKRAAE